MVTKEALLQYLVFFAFTISLIFSGYNVGAEDAASNCTSQTNQSSCCGVTGCSWYSCNATTSPPPSCKETGNDSTCIDQCSENPTSTAAPPPAVTLMHALKDTCETYFNQTDCCNATGCGFISCVNHTGCHNANDNSTISKFCPKGHNDTCIVGPVTPTPATSPTPSPTKPSPTAPPTGPPTTANPTTANPTTAAPNTGGNSGQHFDGASFIGGIILCAGIVAIVFFGCKFYKARQERNYHTL